MWARQWLRLYGAQDRALHQFCKNVQLEDEMAEVSVAVTVSNSWWSSLAQLAFAAREAGVLTLCC
ncbi:hypothetical protein HaLaN_01782 [Haematococcus lacustris]|uniref:Uncharacterized protein n=1 Tax=Haematococcus lacustris TaxID=44745 RepID=A0A699YLW9_HAELA|nr:hypothetical protein HaLaN_01782 [Haematococcus lacustris]